jgi:hypothetical protein
MTRTITLQEFRHHGPVSLRDDTNILTFEDPARTIMTQSQQGQAQRLSTFQQIRLASIALYDTLGSWYGFHTTGSYAYTTASLCLSQAVWNEDMGLVVLIRSGKSGEL